MSLLAISVIQYFSIAQPYRQLQHLRTFIGPIAQMQGILREGVRICDRA